MQAEGTARAEVAEELVIDEEATERGFNTLDPFDLLKEME